MTSNIKEQIQADLQQAKATGQLKTERIREIVKAAVSQVGAEFKDGSIELRNLVKDAVSAVIETFQEKGSEIKEEVTASIEGVLAGVNNKRHEAISQTHSELQKLQSQLDSEEEKLQHEVNIILADIGDSSQDKSTQAKQAIAAAIHSIQNSEEVTLLQKRYAQLQAQLAIIKANLAARYGGRDRDVQSYLDEAKNWYNQARPQAEAIVSQVEEKRSQMEDKIGAAGAAIARKEHQVRQILRELFLATADFFKDKEPVNK